MFVGHVLSPPNVCKEHVSLQTGSMITVAIGVPEPLGVYQVFSDYSVCALVEFKAKV